MRIDAGLSICLALILAVMGAGAAAAEPQIVWQVENPFRFFLDPADTQVHRATWLSLSETERSHPVQAAERALERAPSRRLEHLHLHQDLLGLDDATATPAASAPTISIPRAIRSWRGWRGSRTRRPSIAAG